MTVPRSGMPCPFKCHRPRAHSTRCFTGRDRFVARPCEAAMPTRCAMAACARTAVDALGWHLRSILEMTHEAFRVAACRIAADGVVPYCHCRCANRHGQPEPDVPDGARIRRDEWCGMDQRSDARAGGSCLWQRQRTDRPVDPAHAHRPLQQWLEPAGSHCRACARWVAYCSPRRGRRRRT